MKKDDKIIKLFDEEGNEVSFNVVAFFDIVNPETDEKNEYVIVYEEGYSEDDTFALKVINGEDGEELLEAIDNEVELAAVQEAYNTIFIDIEALKESLKQKGYKLTPQRRSILDIIIEKEGMHLTVEEIYDEVKKVCPEIGLATVYRTVLLFEELNVIYKLDLNDGCSRYELVHEDEEHRHHHLICNKCKKVIEVQDDLLEELEERIRNTYGFDILDHSVKFFGICSECKNKEEK